MFSSIKKGYQSVNILLGITLFIFSFGQIGRLAPFEIPVFVNAYELFLFCAVTILVFRLRIPKELQKHNLVKSILFFCIALGIRLVISLFQYNAIQNILATLYYVRLVFYFVFLIYFSYYLKKFSEVIPYYKVIVTVFTGLVIIFSCIQYFLYPNIGNIAYAGWDPHLFRLVGVFLDPPLTASVFILSALFLLYCYKNIRFKFIGISIFLILFFLTYSRGGFVALLVTVIIFSLRKMKWKYLLGFVIVTGLLLFIIPKNMSEGLNLARTTSIKTRLVDYNKAIRIWKKSPLIGIGYNHIRAEKDSYVETPIVEKYNPSHASASFHSSFLIILVTGGVIGLLLFLLVLFRIAQVGDLAFYIVIFLSVYSLTDNVLLHPFILFLGFLLIGLIHPSRT